jgi:hypothetical protein
VAWLDPLEELDELGVLDGDWSWPLLDDWLVPLLDPVVDVLVLLPEPELVLAFADEWPE